MYQVEEAGMDISYLTGYENSPRTSRASRENQWIRPGVYCKNKANVQGVTHPIPNYKPVASHAMIANPGVCLDRERPVFWYFCISLSVLYYYLLYLCVM